MEDLIYFLVFIIIGGISIVSKIVTHQKNKSNFTGGKVPLKQTPVKKHSFAGVLEAIQEAIDPKPVPVVKKQVIKKSPQKQGNHKKALIEEEPTQIAKVEPAPEQGDTTYDQPISESSYKSLGAALQENKKFAFVCHEIFGKPKALED